MATDAAPHPERPRVVLGVGGGIAAYKAVELLRLLTESGHDVVVAPTAAALRFVGAPTWAALSGHPVSTDVWTDVHEVPHVLLGRRADLVVIAPATADLMARAAAGRADDLLTSTLLTVTCPVVMAPAMHTEMWEHPATRANVATLRARGVVVVDPAVGRLTGADSGAGRLPDPSDIAATALAVLQVGLVHRDLEGIHVVVSAGGTREPVDPVRWLGNRSSGRQGVALARAAVVRGARVTLVAAHLTVPTPAGVDVVTVGTAAQLEAAVVAAAATADVVVMAAAVADFRPTAVATSKIKKGTAAEPASIALERNPDVLAGLVADRASARDAGNARPQVLVGFAAETGDATASVLEHGRTKLARKGVDLLVVNGVGDEKGGGTGFETADNAVTVLGAGGSVTEVPRSSKDVVAHRVWDEVVRLLRP